MEEWLPHAALRVPRVQVGVISGGVIMQWQFTQNHTSRLPSGVDVTVEPLGS